MKEALRCLRNARNILTENDYYADIKPVREASGTAYLAVLEAINEALLKKAFTRKYRPKSVDEYRKILKKQEVNYDNAVEFSFNNRKRREDM